MAAEIFNIAGKALTVSVWTLSASIVCAMCRDRLAIVRWLCTKVLAGRLLHVHTAVASSNCVRGGNSLLFENLLVHA